MASSIGQLYSNTYKILCGQHPHELPWHFQWLSTLYLHRRLSRLLPDYGGRVLDVGCGNQPYRNWFDNVTEYTGLDVVPGALIDVVVYPDEQWPLPSHFYDVVLSTQVIEHSANLELTLEQMTCALKDKGVVILSFPFLYNVHGAPYDYRRFTHFGAGRLLPGYEILHLETQDGIGSTLAVLLLNWIDAALNSTVITRVLKGALLPVFIILSFIVNMLALMLDHFDRTEAFYSNVLLVARKRSE